MYKTDKYKKISIIYTLLINSIVSKVEEKLLLPLDIKINKKRGYSPIFEPSKDEVIEYSIKKALFGNLNYRRNAMNNGTKNCNELIDKLNLEYNKTKQTAITQVITEVVAGNKGNK